MTEYASFNRYNDHLREAITERDAERVAERLNELGWEKVVRCRNCRFFKLDQSDHDHRGPWRCEFWNTDLARPEKFCAWAVRRSQ